MYFISNKQRQRIQEFMDRMSFHPKVKEPEIQQIENKPVIKKIFLISSALKLNDVLSRNGFSLSQNGKLELDPDELYHINDTLCAMDKEIEDRKAENISLLKHINQLKARIKSLEVLINCRN